MFRLSFILLLVSVFPYSSFAEMYDDKIMVIVNDKVILKSEVQNAIDNLSPDEITREYSTLNDREIIKKVIDKMIDKNLILQAAERFDIRISDIALENKVKEIATREGLSVNELRNKIMASGQNYQKFLTNLKDEMTVDALFVTQFYSRANVTEEEVDNFMRREKINEFGNIKYDLIEFVLIDEDKMIEDETINNIYKSAVASGFVEAERAFGDYQINIRNIGVVEINDLPESYADALRNTSDGDFTSLIKTSRGYHILKINSAENQSIAYVDEYKVRHILIKPDPMTSDKEVKQKLFDLRDKITNVEDFAAEAKKHSADFASAFNGGDLNWQRSKNLVSEFSSVMEKTPINTISDPFSTQFGWHILYVENTRVVDDAKAIIRGNIAKAIRANKAKREKNDWKAKLKDQAFIDIKEF